MDQKKPLGLSLIIPTFNEKKNIKPLLENLKELSESIDFPFEVIIVDGNSNDGTQNILKSLFTDLNPDLFSLIQLNSTNGYGFDILQGLDRARYDILAWTHADLQTDVNDVKKAFNKLNSSKSINLIIKGERKNRNFLDFFFTFGMQLVVFLYLKVVLNDINAQPKLFTREFYEDRIKEGAPKDFSLDLYLLFQAKKNKYLIESIPVYFLKRIHGDAKGGGGNWKNRTKLIKRTFSYIRELSKK